MRASATLVVLAVVLAGAGSPPARAQTAPAREVAATVASYLARWIPTIANVVAQEDFVITNARQMRNRISSEFLFVSHPLAARDWLTFRDVFEVNGVIRRDRQARLRQLFLEPPGNFAARAQAIVLDSSAYVPPVLNPYFAVSFLQRDYQPRFSLDTKAAGAEFPAGVVALTFLETARPTLLRSGASSEQDAPARGTVWIEEATGRVLETELQVKVGRDTSTMRTTFATEERLGTMLPARMRTSAPEGTATYSNFRRFDVRTETTVKPLSEP
jgi:hypothetical protein